MIPMTNLVTSCHHTELLQCGWLYLLSCTLHPWDFWFIAFAFGLYPETSLSFPMSKSLWLVFPSRSFIVSGHTINAFLYKKMVQFDPFACSCPVSPIAPVEQAIFSLSCALASYGVDELTICTLFLGSLFCSTGLCVCFRANTIPVWWP